VDQLTLEKKVVWYIPDLLALARSGTHQGQSASILDQILPAVIAGRLVVWTEATPTSVARLLQLRPVLRGLFEVVQLEPQSDNATLALTIEVAKRISHDADIAIDPGCADVAVASAPISQRRELSRRGAPTAQAHSSTLRPRRRQGGAERRAQDAVPAHRPAGLDS